ncbi:MAG: hypothetical protein QE265_11205 [Rhodoferax sp.]|nr:hypothetical protein [Rhodoferax sp.]
MSGSIDWLWWCVCAVFVLAVAVYLLAELQAYGLRTAVAKIPGGQRFTARAFSVDMLRSAGKLRVKTRQAHYSQPAQDEQAPIDKTGPLDVTFEAVGLRIDIAPLPRAPAPAHTAFWAHAAPWRAGQKHSVTFHAAPAQATLRLDNVPTHVAERFWAFAKQVEVWVERTEQQHEEQLRAQAAAQREAEELAASRAAAKAKGKAVSIPPEEQIAQWRRVAGFTGSSSEIGLDSNGQIDWFIDLDPTGRITLHSGKQTAHTTLRGATITSLGGELEINVLDADDHPDPHSFRVLKNMPPDVRRAWKERLEMLRDSLKRSPLRPL